jgi:hypothetical protein
VQRLHEKGLVPKKWWETYRPRQIEATEAPYEKLMERHKPTKVVSIKSAKPRAAKRTEAPAA